MADRLDLSDKTAISMPMRNLLAILATVGIGVYSYFGVQERLNSLETRVTLSEADLTKNTEFRIKWPRGEMGQLPADNEQYMLLEFLSGQTENIQKEMESMMSNTVNIDFLKKQVAKLQDDVEKLKDKVRNNGGDH